MTNKKCLVFETLGKVGDLEIQESSNSNEVRLSGVFGVCGVKNGNNRIYSKENYAHMVEALQRTIVTEGCPGELEHPASMNIDLNNISHKIESIEMNEDGTITGTILLLNTPKGQIAKAIVEGGLPLYISSRGAGSIDESGHVTLSTIKTYDLVGTPGFSQAKLQLASNQSFESLNESLDDGNISWAIVENETQDGEQLVEAKAEEQVVVEEPKEEPQEAHVEEGKDEDPKEDSKEGEDSKEDEKPEEKEDEPKEGEDSKEDEKPEEKEDEPEEKEDNKKDNDETTMKEIKDAIDELTEKVTSLEAELHVAQESLNEKDQEIASLNEKLSAINSVNYDAIETWISKEFAPELKESLISEITENYKDWAVKEFAPLVEGWVVDEYGPQVQNWITEEYSPMVESWVTEEFAPTVEDWVNEEFAGSIDAWINEEFAPAQSKAIEDKVNENVNAFFEAQKTSKMDDIDNLLEALENRTPSDEALKILKEHQAASKWAGVYVVENMPAEYQPTWNTLSEAKQEEIVRSSRMYDFTKEGVLESFWASADMTEKPAAVNEGAKDVVSDYHSGIAQQMMRLRR